MITVFQVHELFETPPILAGRRSLSPVRESPCIHTGSCRITVEISPKSRHICDGPRAGRHLSRETAAAAKSVTWTDGGGKGNGLGPCNRRGRRRGVARFYGFPSGSRAGLVAFVDVWYYYYVRDRLQEYNLIFKIYRIKAVDRTPCNRIGHCKNDILSNFIIAMVLWSKVD